MAESELSDGYPSSAPPPMASAFASAAAHLLNASISPTESSSKKSAVPELPLKTIVHANSSKKNRVYTEF